MKLLFSEAQPEFDAYVFPYAIWGIPEAGETPADLFARGFLPSSLELDRFYLCRNVRVALKKFKPSSENRRLLRKGQGIRCDLVSRAQYPYTEVQRRFFQHYAEVKFGPDVMGPERLDALMGSRVVNHLLVFSDEATDREVGTVMMYLEAPRVAFYYFAFYDLEYQARSLGLHMMTSAVERFAKLGFHHLHLGTAYSRNALYKTQFSGVEFFNGFEWCPDIRQLKHLIGRNEVRPQDHLLESRSFLAEFYGSGLEDPVHRTPFVVR